MTEGHLTCRVRIKKHRSYRGEVGRVAPNVIQRDFNADKPYQKLAADIAELSLFGTKLSLSPLMDMSNGETFTYLIYERPALSQVTYMLQKAFEVVPD